MNPNIAFVMSLIGLTLSYVLVIYILLTFLLPPVMLISICLVLGYVIGVLWEEVFKILKE